MKTRVTLLIICLAGLPGLALSQDTTAASRWRLRFDIGGNLPESPAISEIGGPVTSGGKLELDAGMSFDLGAGYRVAPWLLIEAGLGFTFNNIDSVGNWSYPDSSLSQMSMMLNAEFAYPIGRLIPYAGIGGGGVLSSISFGNYYYYYYSDSDGWGSDFVPAAQAFAGLRFEFDPHWSAAIAYRFLATPGQDWNVEWWDGLEFTLGVDRVVVHSISVSITGSF